MRFILPLFLTFIIFASPLQAAPQDEDVLVNGTSIHYIREGPSQKHAQDSNEKGGPRGIPVVMIHGTYSSMNVFRMSIFDGVSKKYKAIAFDLPGYGKSKRPKLKMTYDDRVEMIHEAIQKLGIEKPVLAGHSSGGSFILRYAMKYPDEVRALVLISPYTEPFGKADAIYRVATTPVIGDLFYYLAVKPVQLFRRDWTMAKPGFFPNEVNRDYAQREVGLALRRKTFRANANDVKTLGPALGEMSERYGEIKIPAIIITGENDPISVLKTNGGDLHKKIPHSKLILLPQTGHNPLFSKQEEILEAIDLAVGV